MLSLMLAPAARVPVGTPASRHSRQ